MRPIVVITLSFKVSHLMTLFFSLVNANKCSLLPLNKTNVLVGH